MVDLRINGGALLEAKVLKIMPSFRHLISVSPRVWLVIR